MPCAFPFHDLSNRPQALLRLSRLTWPDTQPEASAKVVVDVKHKLVRPVAGCFGSLVFVTQAVDGSRLRVSRQHPTSMLRALCIAAVASVGGSVSHEQAVDDLHAYRDQLATRYSWGALQPPVDAGGLVDEAIAGLPDGDVSLEALQETLRRIQVHFADYGAWVALPDEPCDLGACSCSGVSLAALRGQVRTVPAGADGYTYMLAVCDEIPHAWLPSGCNQTDVSSPTAVRFNAHNPTDCTVLGSVGACAPDQCGMSSVKTEAGLTVTYAYTDHQCRHTFELDMTAGGHEVAPAQVQPMPRSCGYRAEWAADGLAALGEESLFAPFLVYETSPGVFVALRPDRSDWIDTGHPVITRIDGVAVALWVAAAKALAGQQRRAVRMLTDVWRLRSLRELQGAVSVPDASQVTLSLASLDGRSHATQSYAGVPSRPSYGDGLEAWPRKELPESAVRNQTFGAQILPGTNTGYLRLPTMEQLPDPLSGQSSLSRWVRTLLQAMAADNTQHPQGVFSTDSLVIDVRGSFGNGNRDIVQALIPFFMTNVDRKHCQLIGSASVALKSRQLPPTWDRAEYLEAPSNADPSFAMAAVLEFDKSFTPTGVDGGNLTEVLHEFERMEYMAVPSPSFDITPAMSVNAWYHYANPVIILQDEDSQGAVEVLLGAFKALSNIAPNVKLMGKTSGGMVSSMLNTSAGSISGDLDDHYTLPNSKIRVKLAATVGFAPDGVPYAGHGIVPNIEFETDPSSLLKGRPDTMLAAAVRELSLMTPGNRGAQSCNRGAAPNAEDQAGQICLKAYNGAFHSTLQGVCYRTNCSPQCQSRITDMLRTCANDTYEEMVQYYTAEKVVRGFNTRAVQALKILGPPNCDYSLLSTTTRCHPECSLDNLVNSTGQRWADLRECLHVDMHAPNAHSKQPAVAWDPETCATTTCEDRFNELVADCRACDTGAPSLAPQRPTLLSVIGVAVDKLVHCRESVASCDSVLSTAKGICCAGADCGYDGFPTVCSFSGSGRHGMESLCQEAVREAALLECPITFLNASRLQGLYMVSCLLLPSAVDFALPVSFSIPFLTCRLTFDRCNSPLTVWRSVHYRRTAAATLPR